MSSGTEELLQLRALRNKAALRLRLLLRKESVGATNKVKLPKNLLDTYILYKYCTFILM